MLQIILINIYASIIHNSVNITNLCAYYNINIILFIYARNNNNNNIIMNYNYSIRSNESNLDFTTAFVDCIVGINEDQNRDPEFL